MLLASEAMEVTRDTLASQDKSVDSFYIKLIEELKERCSSVILSASKDGVFHVIYPTRNEVMKYLTGNKIKIDTAFTPIVLRSQRELATNLDLAGYRVNYGHGGDINIGWGGA